MNKKLLIVDDDIPFKDRLLKSMEKKGFEVDSLSNPMEVIERIKINI